MMAATKNGGKLPSKSDAGTPRESTEEAAAEEGQAERSSSVLSRTAGTNTDFLTVPADTRSRTRLIQAELPDHLSRQVGRLRRARGWCVTISNVASRPESFRPIGRVVGRTTLARSR